MHKFLNSIITALLSIFLVMLVGCGKSDAQKKAEQQKMENALKEKEEKEAINNLLLVLKNQLKDPDSAKFKDVKIIKATYDLENTKYAYQICGEVNSKNSFGGYVGFHGFVVSNNIHGKPTVYMQTDSMLNVIWEKIAKDTGCIS